MKILIIGCPGSGKSTLAKQLSKEFKIPLLHLDRIYHIDNFNHITREDLMKRIYEFSSQSAKWIIDGNYLSTMPKRLEICDTVIFMKIPSDICYENAIKRSQEYANKQRSDIAEGFDDSIIDRNFLEYIKTFDLKYESKIEEILTSFNTKKIIRINSYSDLDNIISVL